MTCAAERGHDVLFYRSDAELLAAAVPFLQAGLAADEAVVLMGNDRNNQLLAEALDRDPRIGVLERADVHTRTLVAIANYRRMVEERLAAGARRVRMVGDANFGADPDTWAQWIRFEAVLNVALAPYPLWTVCAYDTRVLPERILAVGHCTHPHLLTASARTVNTRYVAPAPFLRQSATVHPDPPGTTVAAFESDHLTHVAELAGLRANVRSALAGSAAPHGTLSDFVAAISEVAANAVVHGRPGVRVRVWASPRQLVCTVTDQGDGFDDPLAGYLPVRTDESYRTGRGLWLVRHLCDHLETSRTGDGFDVRLATTVPLSQAPATR